MRALISSPEGPVIGPFDNPVTAPGYIKVRVKAAALNRADLAMLTGASHGVAGGMGLPLGLEWAGEVIEVGEGVTGWQVGERAMAASPGAFADEVVVPANWAHPVPDAMSDEQAAALPVALQTAHDALTGAGQLQAGQSVLVLGASSAVGLMAMQVARVLGASQVIGTSTTADRLNLLTEFGATKVVNTRDEDWSRQVLKATKMKGVDLVIDFLAGPLFNATMQATRIGGRIVNVGRMAGETGAVDFDQHSMRRIQYVGTTFRTRSPAEIGAVIELARHALMPALKDGQLRMPLDCVMPRSQATEAFARMRANAHFGKIVLTCD